MHALVVIAKRELRSYFGSPLAYVFMFAFTLLACGAALLPEFELFGRSFGGLLDRPDASMVVFFETMPFLLAFFAPAIAMKLWAYERKTGTIELLFTYPLSTSQVILGKFVGAWIVLLVAFLMTLPLVILIGFVGTLSYSLILSGYVGTLLLAGAFTAIACAASALTDNTVLSLILGVVICGLLLLVNLIPIDLGFLDGIIRSLGALEHFQDLVTGKISISSIVYFLSLMAGSFFLNLFFLDIK